MKNHYDVCIAGVWYGYNYGSLLNGYATYRIMKGMGKNVLMLQKPNASENDREITEGHNTSFVKKYYDSDDISPALPFSRLGELNEICDCFCTGSDQIWNYAISFRENMYLPFASDDKKLISFATSFGHKNDPTTPEEARPRIRKYLQRYSAISVREQFDVDILRDIYGINGTLVIDPVFCVDLSLYDELAADSDFDEKSPYILAYILDPTSEKREAIQFYGEISGMKVINILDGAEHRWNENNKILDLPNTLNKPGTCDFIKAYKNASFIITDSFHGTAFSVIFNKTFISLGNSKRGLERFVDLLGRLKLMDRLVSADNIPKDEKYLLPFDYTETNNIIINEKHRTIEWLTKALEGSENLNIKLKNNVTTGLKKSLCMGCGACVSVCPTDALSLKADQHGYYRPDVDPDKCVECGKCVKTCPALDLPKKSNSITPELYEFITADEKILWNSSSGGAFTILAYEAFKKGGIVYGAAWKDDFSVEHICIDSENDLYKLQKSKYLQSYMGNIYRNVREKLEQNIFVLFSGCPCQVAGLRAYLNKDYDNLIAVDLLCGNSPSSLFFKKYIEEAFPEGLKKYEFRHKVQGWNSDCTTTTTTTGITAVFRGGKQDSYQRVYHSHTMCPPHCENCRYQSVPRYGDITIGDFWGLNNKDKTVDTSKGISAVLCNNEKGKQFFNDIPDSSCLVRKQVPLGWLGGNGYAINGSHNYCSVNRDSFYKAILTMPFTQAVNYAVKPNHGIYEKQIGFNYKASTNHFRFSPLDWREEYIDNSTVLFAQAKNSKPGKHASLLLPYSLTKGKKYIFKIRFRVATESSVLNFHVKSFGEPYVQVVYSHKVSPDDSVKWVEIEKDFVPDFDFYDAVSVGASQISGINRWLAIDYIQIHE